MRVPGSRCAGDDAPTAARGEPLDGNRCGRLPHRGRSAAASRRSASADRDRRVDIAPDGPPGQRHLRAHDAPRSHRLRDGRRHPLHLRDAHPHRPRCTARRRIARGARSRALGGSGSPRQPHLRRASRHSWARQPGSAHARHLVRVVERRPLESKLEVKVARLLPRERLRAPPTSSRSARSAWTLRGRD